MGCSELSPPHMSESADRRRNAEDSFLIVIVVMLRQLLPQAIPVARYSASATFVLTVSYREDVLVMAQNEQALKVALAAAKQLPRALQRRLAEQLLATAAPDQETTVVSLQRLSSKKQLRHTKLIEKRAESPLSRSEQRELKQLGAEVEQMLLANSQALALALRPELFDERGRPVQARFQHALSVSPPAQPQLRQGSIHR